MTLFIYLKGSQERGSYARAVCVGNNTHTHTYKRADYLYLLVDLTIQYCGRSAAT